MFCHSHWNKVYSHWNKGCKNKEKIFGKKSFVPTFRQTNRQTNIWTKPFEIDLTVFNFCNFIQCNTIVQLTNYFSIIIIKNNACTFHNKSIWQLKSNKTREYLLWMSYNISWELLWKYKELDSIVLKIKYSSPGIEKYSEHFQKSLLKP